KSFAPRNEEMPRYLRDVADSRRRGCVHCHQVKEMLDRDREKHGTTRDDLAWRYPLPENIGLELEVDRGNVVKMVNEASPSAKAGLRPGDVVKQLNGVPIHSMADVQFALDRAPKTGATAIAWQRGEQEMSEQLALASGWRKTDLTWRPSMQDRLAAAR